MPLSHPGLDHRKPPWHALRAATLLVLGCAGGPAPEKALELSPCRLNGLNVAARCGLLTVFEDRAAARGRTIDLRVAVVPALASSPRPDPLFLLVGGPGQAATEAGAVIAEQLRDVLRHRDIVLVDQRGTGQSHPLRCESDQQQPLQELFAPRPDAEETRACHAALDADTRQYATLAAMDDLDDVRAALGYERINLWGGSYGTRAALVYLRQHPERVRSLVLDGSAPFAIALPQHVARDAQRALDLMFADCQHDADCQRAFPAAQEHWQALLDRLGSGGLDVSVTHPRSGAPLGLRIERAGLASAVRNLLYVPELAGLLPLAIERATGGDFGAFVASADAFSRGVSVSTGMFLSIVCAEDVPRIDDSRAEQLSQGTFLGGGWLREMRAECDNWPAAQLPPAYFEPIASDVPALLLSGNLDPVTPPSWGELVASSLSRARHVVVPGAGHGTTSLGCVPELIAEFVERRDPAGLDPSCVERQVRPAYFTSLQGPTP
jgi:pimeloyl-ACP methyl ester carboxylesterase